MDSNNSQKTFRLPVAKIILEAFLIPWKRRYRFVSALLVPTAMMLFISVATYWIVSTLFNPTSASAAISEDQLLFVNSNPAGFTLLVFVLLITSTAVYTLYAITVHRLMLLGDNSVPRYGLFKWSWRETRFIIWAIAVSLICGFVFIILFMLLNIFTLPFVSPNSKQFVLSVV
jgi:isoprenylcysteine carboxyl methyltransferase (ICMT) family protein YpbQ